MTPSAIFIAYALASWIFLIGRGEPVQLPDRVPVVRDSTVTP